MWKLDDKLKLKLLTSRQENTAVAWLRGEQIFHRKLFRPSNIEIVHYCKTVFGCELPSVLLVARYDKFIKKLACFSL